jgi:hypothetical protein
VIELDPVLCSGDIMGFSETVIVQLDTCDDGAGLVMQHGTETIHKYQEEYRAEQHQLIEKANQRGGISLENSFMTLLVDSETALAKCCKTRSTSWGMP